MGMGMMYMGCETLVQGASINKNTNKQQQRPQQTQQHKYKKQNNQRQQPGPIIMIINERNGTEVLPTVNCTTVEFHRENDGSFTRDFNLIMKDLR